MNRILNLLPEADSEEAMFLDSLLKEATEDQLKNFILIYRGRRKDAQTVLLLALIGFLGVSGVHRFMLNQIGMGILYFFTGGLCLIGTIVDLVNHKSLAFEYNQRVAREIKMML